MSNIEGQEFAIARTYSTAMLELAESRGEVDQLLEELLDFAQRVDKDPDLAAFMTSPEVDGEARRKTFEKLFRGRYSDLFVDTLQVLNCKDRLSLVRAIAEAYRLAHEELRGRVEVFVTTAAPLTDSLRRMIRDVAAGQTAKQVDLVEAVDESLIGGLILRIGDRKFDASVARRLRMLGEVVLDRASREIHDRRDYVIPGA